MSNESLYFPHDYDSTMDNKHKAMLSEYGAVGYGLYWLIVESLHSESEHKLPLKKLTYLAFTQQAKLSYEEIETFIKKCIDDYELFVSDGEYFYADRVLRNIKKRAEIVEKKREAGRLGGQKRVRNIEQNSSTCQANSSTCLAESSTCLAESSKEKKRKEKNIKETTTDIYIEKEINKEKDVSVIFLNQFDEFRKIYQGVKRGLETEFDNLKKKHKDWKSVIPLLKPNYQKQLEINKQKAFRGEFVPPPKHLQTYINQRCWEEEINTIQYIGTQPREKQFEQKIPAI